MKTKTLILVRHAKSSWKNLDLDDHDRPLNKRGKRDLPEMGERLKGEIEGPALIISSTAKRATKTAKGLCQALGYELDCIKLDAEVFGASKQKLIKVIRSTSNTSDQIMLVGHNPGMAEAADYLSRSKITSMPTCAVAIFKFAIEEWIEVNPSSATLIYYDYPKNIDR